MSEDKAYDMWKELEAAKAEIDRLRAELTESREQCAELEAEAIDNRECEEEIDRLRAFAQAEAKRYLEACNDKTVMRNEIDRLRAENAELRKAAQSLVSEIRITGTHGSWKYLAEILSKTEKEGE